MNIIVRRNFENRNFGSGPRGRTSYLLQSEVQTIGPTRSLRAFFLFAEYCLLLPLIDQVCFVCRAVAIAIFRRCVLSGLFQASLLTCRWRIFARKVARLARL
jgi:hypothetical protein